MQSLVPGQLKNKCLGKFVVRLPQGHFLSRIGVVQKRSALDAAGRGRWIFLIDRNNEWGL